MRNKLILVEGIPGSGKSTISRKIQAYLKGKNINAVLFNEGDVHPADLSWCSYIPVKEYEALIDEYKQYSQVIKDYTLIENDFAIVAYTKLGFKPSENEIMKFFEAHEVYDGRADLESFINIHKRRWRGFSEKAVYEDSIYIFECAFFQNHICELMGIHNKDNKYISNHLISLIETVKMLNPLLIYLSQPDVSETITRVAKERVSANKSKYSDWIDLIINWVEKSQYGIKYNLKGFDGVIDFLEERKKVEMNVYGRLPIDKYIVENPNYNWEGVFDTIERILLNNIIHR